MRTGITIATVAYVHTIGVDIESLRWTFATLLAFATAFAIIADAREAIKI